jgi:hypothetical protein
MNVKLRRNTFMNSRLGRLSLLECVSIRIPSKQRDNGSKSWNERKKRLRNMEDYYLEYRKHSSRYATKWEEWNEKN